MPLKTNGGPLYNMMSLQVRAKSASSIPSLPKEQILTAFEELCTEA